MGIVVGLGASRNYEIADAVQSLVVRIGTSQDSVCVGEKPYIWKSGNSEFGLFRQQSVTGNSFCFYLARVKRFRGTYQMDESCKVLLVRQNKSLNPVAKFDSCIRGNRTCLSVELNDARSIITSFFDYFLCYKGCSKIGGLKYA